MTPRNTRDSNESPPRDGGPTVVPIGSREPQDADRHRMARGLQAARQLEATHGLVRGVRRWAKLANKGAQRTKARSQLKRLMELLERLQQQVLANGISESDATILTERQSGIERALELVTDEKSGKSQLKLVVELAREQRKLTARLLQV